MCIRNRKEASDGAPGGVRPSTLLPPDTMRFTKEEIEARWAAHIEKQMVEIPGTQRPGFSPVYRNAAFPMNPPMTNPYDSFMNHLKEKPDANCLGHRPFDEGKGDLADYYSWRSYADVAKELTDLGSALSKFQEEGLLKPRPNDKNISEPGLTNFTVAYWGANRPESMITMLSQHSYTRQSVLLYDNFDAAGSCYILQHSVTRVLLCPSKYVPIVLRNADKLPALKVIVLIDRPGSASATLGELSKLQLVREWAAMHGIEVRNYKEVLDIGARHPYPHVPNKDLNNLSTLCYTSGTTGLPKGVRVTTRGLLEGLEGLRWVISDRELVSISYLPLAHIYERGWETFVLYMGGSIGYFSGQIERLMEDLQILQPTVMPSVPRVLNRIAGQIQMQMDAPGLKGKLLTKAVHAKLENYYKTGSVTHALWDRLVFRKVRALLGGQVELILTGSAPCRRDVLELLRIALCTDIREGYGQTENNAYASIMGPGDRRVGCVGPVNPGVELRLRDCPELGYTSQDKPCPRGEIVLRSNSVFDGYEGDEKKTKETLMPGEDGKGPWLLTGDVGRIDEYGRLQIIDRVKNLIKLAQGEYIAIEKVESVFSSLPLVQQVWLYGDSFQPHLVAVAVPEPSVFAPFASKVLGQTVSPSDAAALESAVNDSRVVEAVLREFVKLGKTQKLGTLEQMRALKLRMEPFSPDNGLMTPTLKVKRQEAAKVLKADLDELYRREPINLNNIKI